MRSFRAVSLAALVAIVAAGAARGQDQMPWQPNIEAAQQIAAQTNRLVLLHFWSNNCAPCVKLDRDVFSKPEVARALDQNFVMVKLNVEEAPGTARLYGVSSIPTDVIVLPNGRLVSQLQSPPSATQYVTQMNQVADGHRALAGAPLSQAAQQMAATQTVPNPVPNAPPGPPAAAPAVAPVNPTAPAAQAPPQSNDRYAEYYRQQPGATGGAPELPSAAATYPSRYDAAAQVAAQVPVATQPPAAHVPTAAQSPPAMAAAPPAYQQSPYQQPVQQAAPAQSPPALAVAAAGGAAGPAATQAAYRGELPPPPQLPPGSPPLGLDGYCSVTLLERQQWAMGDAKFGAIHRGKTYLFLGPAEVKKFLANPELYAPMLSGNDPVMALDNQMLVPGKREFGVYADNRVYLFADEASRRKFEQNPKRYSAEALQAAGHGAGGQAPLVR